MLLSDLPREPASPTDECEFVEDDEITAEDLLITWPDEYAPDVDEDLPLPPK